MNLSRGAAYELYKNLKILQDSGYSGFEFGLTIVKNMLLLKPNAELVEKSLVDSKRYTEYDSQRLSLCQKYGTLDAKTNQFTIGDKFRPEFIAGHEILLAQYEKDINARKKDMDKWRDFKKEGQTDYDLFQFKEGDLPKDLKTDHFGIIADLLYIEIEPVKKGEKVDA